MERFGQTVLMIEDLEECVASLGEIQVAVESVTAHTVKHQPKPSKEHHQFQMSGQKMELVAMPSFLFMDEPTNQVRGRPSPSFRMYR